MTEPQGPLRTDSGPFSIVPEWLLDDATVSDGAVRQYAVLARHADKGDGVAFPARSTLARRLGCSVDTVDRRTKELLAAGAITVEHKFTERGDHTSNTYRVLRVRARADAATCTDPATPPQGGGDGGRADAAQNESQPEPESSDDTSAAKAAAGSKRQRKTDPRSDALVREWWDAQSPKPTWNYLAARGIVSTALKRNWSEAQIRAALATLPPPFTAGQLDYALRNPRRAVRAERSGTENMGDEWTGREVAL